MFWEKTYKGNLFSCSASVLYVGTGGVYRKNKQIFEYPLTISNKCCIFKIRTNVSFPEILTIVRFSGQRLVYTYPDIKVLEGTNMQTMYYKTSNFIRHTGNVVDLNEFRRRQAAAAQRDSLARQPEVEAYLPEEEPGFQPVVLTLSPEERRRTRRERRAWRLDAYASLAVVLMTLVFALRVML